MSNIRILMADDHPTFLQIARRFLASQQTVEIVGESSHGEGLFEMLEQLNPDIVITDIAMPGMGGLAVIEKLHAEYPHIGVVALTLFDTAQHREAALAAGAHSFVAKAILYTDLMDAIQTAADAVSSASI